MRIFVANLILYTPENGRIPEVASIKDTMIYDLCLTMCQMGHDVTLYAADAYCPLEQEEYPFLIIWGKCKCKKLFKPSALPFTPDLLRFMKRHGREYDLVISSEVFSMASLILTRTANERLIVWHELAKHNRMLHRIPSKIWYHVIARFFFNHTRVVARSEEAKRFIRQFCPGTQEEVIDHGVNLSLFQSQQEKKNDFVVCSQLIPRKQIDGIIHSFYDFLRNGQEKYRLLIIGEGTLRNELEKLVGELGLDKQVVFTGKLSHQEMIPYLSGAKGLLVNTRQDNNMVSIVESIAVGTPVLTTDVPYNCSYIRSDGLGIVQDAWGAEQIEQLVRDNESYVANCLRYRHKLATEYKVEQFIRMAGRDEDIDY